MSYSEIDALKAVDDALSKVGEVEQVRVLRWAFEKYGGEEKIPQAKGIDNQLDAVEEKIPVHSNEIAGIARLDKAGKFYLTVRDIKAKHTNDAAIRLAHIVIFAYQKLTGEESVSSKKVVMPLLRQWRSYTGNTRKALSRHKGILRNGDELSLDAHSMNDAEKFIEDALNESLIGKWKP